MAATQIVEGVYWVGQIEYGLRDFHGLSTPQGTTNNAYLIVDEKVALIDPGRPELLRDTLDNIAEVVDPARIGYVVSNHSEPDHAGAIPAVTKVAKGVKVIATAKGVDTLAGTMIGEWESQAVKEGDIIELGRRRLRFIEAPWLHWPETMFTYLEPDGILFPGDFLATHLASPQRFDDEMADFSREAARYYAYIMRPFANMALKALDKIRDLNITLVAPSHGPILRTRFREVMRMYERMSRDETEAKAAIVYATTRGSTDALARAIADGIAAKGVGARLFDVGVSDLGDMLLEMVESRAVVLGSSTLLGGPAPDLAVILALLRPMRLKGRIGATFGSYAWAGGATDSLLKSLRDAGLDVIEPGVSVRGEPRPDDIAACRRLGEEVGERVKAGGTK